MRQDDRHYWFPAKRYGWGWGLPATWQGWVVMIVWLVGLVVGEMVLHETGWRIGFVAVMAMVLFAVCYATGEPPRWRWGDEER